MSILLVDDDEFIQEALKLNLERAGYRVDVARNGAQAIAKIGDTDPDVVILDIFMPDMDGFETLRRLKQLCSDTRILMISGGGSSRQCNYLEMTSKLGADRVLRKPFTICELVACLEDMGSLRSSRLKDAEMLVNRPS